MPNQRPLIAEIVGPAGAGKSTLSDCLNEHGRNVRAGLTIWGLPTAALLLGAIISAPTLVLLTIDRRRLRVSDLKQVVRLNAFYLYLKKRSESAATSRVAALFLDEGVVFAISKLRADSRGSSARPSRRMVAWERKTIERWAAILSTIVWLDGPDDLLAERIRSREKDHRMKDKSDAEIMEFLSRYRSAYRGVISEIGSKSKIKVMKFRTDSASPDHIAREIFRCVKRAYS